MIHASKRKIFELFSNYKTVLETKGFMTDDFK